METIILHTKSSDDISLILQLAERLGIAYSIPKKEIDENIQVLAKPMAKTIDVELIKKERNYKGVNRKKFDQLIKKINIPQTAEELIAQL